MAKVVMVKASDKAMVSPMGGKALWVKVNARINEYEGKKKYSLSLTFDKKTEKEFKKKIDEVFAESKNLKEFEGKQWRKDGDRCGYKEMEDGTLEFTFQTSAFITDKETGEEVRRYVPILNAATKTKLGNDVVIANGSEMRVSFFPTTYWMTKESNGMNLYINKIVVDKLIEFGGSDNDFSDFGITEVDEFSDMDEDVPF